ncbi:hypothetical protein [Microbispora sp. NPDC049125]|uniref:hypothetical protein n=1 Tax=Microbispora sp. NPDC049125 TaxID=3154929 RepID=UPI00346611B9
MTAKPLGVNQEIALSTIRRRGQWPGGWCMGSTSETRRILDSLVRRGLVRTEELQVNGRPMTFYFPVKDQA